MSGTRDACLCMVCGEVSAGDAWTWWQSDDEGEWRPSLDGETDPMLRCPCCGWEHQDTDDGSGVYEGTLAEAEAEQEKLEPEYGESWADRRAEVVREGSHD